MLNVSLMVATSPNVTALPSARTKILISSYSDAVFRSPSERTRSAPSANRPAGTSIELPATTREISFRVNPIRASSDSFISIRISKSGRPNIETLSTPRCSKSSLISLA